MPFSWEKIKRGAIFTSGLVLEIALESSLNPACLLAISANRRTYSTSSCCCCAVLPAKSGVKNNQSQVQPTQPTSDLLEDEFSGRCSISLWRQWYRRSMKRRYSPTSSSSFAIGTSFAICPPPPSFSSSKPKNSSLRPYHYRHWHCWNQTKLQTK